MALRARSLALSEYNCNDHREDEPSGYLEWHEWARKMGETHIQHRCPECGLYKIWISLKDVARLKAAEADGLLGREPSGE